MSTVHNKGNGFGEWRHLAAIENFLIFKLVSEIQRFGYESGIEQPQVHAEIN